MITHLHIKNIALIDEMEIEFSDGFNIISGETGAGKSMVLDSVNFVLGSRPPKDFVRMGENIAQVDAILYIKNDENMNALNELGIEADEEKTIIISRSLTPAGKSVCKINGKTTTAGILKELAALLFDMHSQHEHHALLTASKHISILDRLCGTNVETLKNELSGLLKTHNEHIKKINEVRGYGSDREQMLDMYSFQIKEIESANLKAGEEDDLTARIRILSNLSTITELTRSALYDLYDGENEPSAIDKLARGKNSMEQLAEQDSKCAPFAEALETIYIQLDDVIHDFRRYADNFEHDPNELIRLENRLDVIYKLKRKYGKTVEDVLLHYKKTKERLEQMQNSEEILKKLEKEVKTIIKKINGVCEKISYFRKEEGKRVGELIEKTLMELGMEDARFSVSIENKENFSSDGFDKVEFLISPNIGEDLKSLAQIASGGEISRVMLAIKTALAGADSIETFIFDEIDAGVSGRTAIKVAQKLSDFSKNHQILCITHLPQIASMADAHFLIEKKSDDTKAITSVEQLDDNKIILELARLIGGAKITDVTLKAAAEMKKLAKGR